MVPKGTVWCCSICHTCFLTHLCSSCRSGSSSSLCPGQRRTVPGARHPSRWAGMNISRRKSSLQLQGCEGRGTGPAQPFLLPLSPSPSPLDITHSSSSSSTQNLGSCWSENSMNGAVSLVMARMAAAGPQVVSLSMKW